METEQRTEKASDHLFPKIQAILGGSPAKDAYSTLLHEAVYQPPSPRAHLLICILYRPKATSFTGQKVYIPKQKRPHRFGAGANRK